MDEKVLVGQGTLGRVAASCVQLAQRGDGTFTSYRVARECGIHPTTAKKHMNAMVANGMLDCYQYEYRPGQIATVYAPTVSDFTVISRDVWVSRMILRYNLSFQSVIPF